MQALKEHPDNTAFHLPGTININLCSEVLETDRDYIRNYLIEKIALKSCTTEYLHTNNQKLVGFIATELLSKQFSDINNFYEELGNLIKSAACNSSATGPI